MGFCFGVFFVKPEEKKMYIFARDGQDWRVKRIKRVVEYFCFLVEITEDQAELLIHQIMDDRGRLEVVWACKTTGYFMKAMERAWKMCKEDQIFHLKIDGPDRFSYVDYCWQFDDGCPI